MRKKASIILTLLTCLYLPVFTFAETIVLKTGKTVKGKLIEKNNKYIKIDFHGVPLTYYLDEIKSVDGKSIKVISYNQMVSSATKESQALLKNSPDSALTYNQGGVTHRMQGNQDDAIISAVEATNVAEQYVVINAGRDQGIKVGDNFELSREHYLSAHVVVFEVADITCKARGYKGTTIENVRAGDKARHDIPTVKEKRDFLWLCAILIGLALGILSVLWLGYTRMSNYIKRHNFWNSRFLSMSFRCLNMWFWFLFLSGSFFIVMGIYLALFVDGLYIQDLMLLYSLVGLLIFGTFCVVLVLIFIFRRAS